ncbi:sensor histidine kinase [Shewanella carassii]|uniref:histidine kinase n=2 Tax=Shewanella carassii TaxID=1987584 RepID=A0ABQ1T8N7_9GAMM|nr:sensor histidine kinase [Shewanella carassii]GGE83518.1 sensor histidine kinase [Shewanella carassii]
MAKILILILLLGAGCASASAQLYEPATDAEMGDEPIEAVFRVGVLANHGVAQAKERWRPMMRYLSQQLPGNRFEVVPLTFTQMNQQLLEHRIHFIVTNPGQYLSLSSQLPLSWLATMRSRKHQGTTFAISSAIIVRADSPVRNIEELRGATVVASDPQALGGYQATVGLLNKRGFAAKRFFGEVRFLGFPLEPLVYQVRDRTVDAAITPFCTLEEMVETGLVEREDYRVINGVKPEGYDCETSSALYPNWSFAASDLVPSHITQAVTLALFDLPYDSEAAIQADIMGWTAPISQLKVIKLYEELELHGGPPPLYEAAIDWVRKNQEWGGVLLLLFLISTLYHLWLEYKFRQKSEYLLAAERQLREKALQLERIQSAAILGEIGAGLAHELNQPIAAITQYSEGAMMVLEQRAASGCGERADAMREVLTKINNQSIRAGAVVHRIRGLLRRRRAEPELIEIEHLLKDALALFQRPIEQQHIELKISHHGTARPLLGDAVGLSQMLVNLLKNAIDALEGVAGKREIQVAIDYESPPPSTAAKGEWLLLELLDSGAGLSASAEELIASFATTKEDGLGLGLAICRDVVTQHNGHLELENRRDCRGCRVRVWLPLAEALPAE